jgi:hypothetical protein
MKNLSRDILSGLMFAVGVVGFAFGEMIVSTVLFASSALVSTIALQDANA